jgi:hypothetical protein
MLFFVLDYENYFNIKDILYLHSFIYNGYHGA